ncbi:class II 3-deoxy-7-phosphoheptulonate synthase [Stomatohabitans albus]|uniref:class II 3-deoxy-7-phosphoheptulonate synthase n=1 Tax=Stomatohabitans albus TaxID=3110766 RepID=UPI00300D63AD
MHDFASTPWTPSSWRSLPVQQEPSWPDEDHLNRVLTQLASEPPLVFAGEARTLTAGMAKAGRGEAFVLQGGDCAETFAADTATNTREKIKVLLQMSTVLTYGAKMPVIKIGRIAGQFAKPRSSETETVDGVTLPSYRGDAVNGLAFTEEDRIPDPDRLLGVYHHSATSLNLIRALVGGGYADLNRVHQWNREFVADSPQGKRYELMADHIQSALDFLHAIGINAENSEKLRATQFFTSHEALLLGYEEALTRLDSTSGDWYDCSAHMLWVGERTRQLDHAHIHFLSGVRNPIGVKVSNRMEPNELLDLISVLNPDNEPGRLTLITRMGASAIRDALPPLLAAVKEANKTVTWITDPCHGNTITSESGYKTRRFDDVLDEIVGFFAAHDAVGTVPGGVHMELTGEDVTECLGGDQDIADLDLSRRYESACDPRLNNAQSLELAFRIAEILQRRRNIV